MFSNTQFSWRVWNAYQFTKDYFHDSEQACNLSRVVYSESQVTEKRMPNHTFVYVHSFSNIACVYSMCSTIDSTFSLFYMLLGMEYGSGPLYLPCFYRVIYPLLPFMHDPLYGSNSSRRDMFLLVNHIFFAHFTSCINLCIWFTFICCDAMTLYWCFLCCALFYGFISWIKNWLDCVLHEIWKRHVRRVRALWEIYIWLLFTPSWKNILFQMSVLPAPPH